MIKKLDKEKVIKVLTTEEFESMNAFNIIPNLSDKVIDFNQKNYDIVDIIQTNFEDKRKYKSELAISLFVMASVQARMKQQFSINELSLAITSQEIIDKLKINIEYEKNENLIKEANTRALLEKYKQEGQELKFNNDIIHSYNKVTEKILEKAKIISDIHILDCSILDVNMGNENYEGSSIAFKGGEYLRGYKIGVLRGITPNGGVLEEICMSTAKTHDLEMSHDMIVKSKYLKEGDYLLEDKGFLDITTFRELNDKRINIIVPARKNMEIYEAAVEAARAKNKWEKHPNKKRKGQEIALIKDLEMFWLEEKEKLKKPKNLKLKYKINVVVIKFEKELNKQILSDGEMISSDGKYAYAVILTNDIKLTGEEIIRLYEMRPEIEEDFRQLKDFWGLNTYHSTKYNVISFVMIASLLGYNLYQIYKESEEGKRYIGKNFIVEERHGLYIVKGVRTAIVVNDYFAIFAQDELLDLYVELNKQKREQLKSLLIL